MTAKRGKSYKQVSYECNKKNNELHRNDKSLKGLQIHEVNPVKLGGDPTDLSNKTFLTRDKHAKVVVWWNMRIREFTRKMEEKE